MHMYVHWLIAQEEGRHRVRQIPRHLPCNMARKVLLKLRATRLGGLGTRGQSGRRSNPSAVDMMFIRGSTPSRDCAEKVNNPPLMCACFYRSHEKPATPSTRNYSVVGDQAAPSASQDACRHPPVARRPGRTRVPDERWTALPIGSTSDRNDPPRQGCNLAPLLLCTPVPCRNAYGRLRRVPRRQGEVGMADMFKRSGER